jgi:hypothetical protein
MDLHSAQVLLSCMSLQAKLDTFYDLQTLIHDSSGHPTFPENVRARLLKSAGTTDEEAIELRDCVRLTLLSDVNRQTDEGDDPDKQPQPEEAPETPDPDLIFPKD